MLKHEYKDIRGLRIPDSRIEDILEDLGVTEDFVRGYLGKGADIPGLFFHHIDSYIKQLTWCKDKAGL